MITSHYYKNTNNTPIMCDWEYVDDQQQEEKRELEYLIKNISPEIRRKLIKILKKEIEKEKKNQTKKEEDKNSGLTN